MSAPMIAFRPIYNGISHFLSDLMHARGQAISLPCEPVHDVETMPELRPRTLKHLLKANHANYALYNHRNHHNHIPHFLGAVYILGGSTEQLHASWDEEAKLQSEWSDPPVNISAGDWREYLAQGSQYQRGFVDFFEDELALNYDYKWKSVVEEYLFQGDKPLFNGILGRLGHPIIHLAYAYQLQSREVAMEALGMAASEYCPNHIYLDDPSYTKLPARSSSIKELLARMATDDRLSFVTDSDDIVKANETVILEYWNAWTLEDPVPDFEEAMETAVALVIATVPPGTHDFNFFTVHVLTVIHAIRILLPLLPTSCHMNLVRQWWLMTIEVYISRGRPKLIADYVDDVQIEGRTWAKLVDAALSSTHAKDSHYVKAVRAMKECADLWAHDNDWYLKAACRFVDDFDGIWRR